MSLATTPRNISSPVRESFIHTGHGGFGDESWGDVSKIDEIYLQNPMVVNSDGTEIKADFNSKTSERRKSADIDVTWSKETRKPSTGRDQSSVDDTSGNENKPHALRKTSSLTNLYLINSPETTNCEVANIDDPNTSAAEVPAVPKVPVAVITNEEKLDTKNDNAGSINDETINANELESEDSKTLEKHEATPADSTPNSDGVNTNRTCNADGSSKKSIDDIDDEDTKNESDAGAKNIVTNDKESQQEKEHETKSKSPESDHAVIKSDKPKRTTILSAWFGKKSKLSEEGKPMPDKNTKEGKNKKDADNIKDGNLTKTKPKLTIDTKRNGDANEEKLENKEIIDNAEGENRDTISNAVEGSPQDKEVNTANVSKPSKPEVPKRPDPPNITKVKSSKDSTNKSPVTSKEQHAPSILDTKATKGDEKQIIRPRRPHHLGLFSRWKNEPKDKPLVEEDIEDNDTLNIKKDKTAAAAAAAGIPNTGVNTGSSNSDNSEKIVPGDQNVHKKTTISAKVNEELASKFQEGKQDLNCESEISSESPLAANKPNPPPRPAPPNINNNTKTDTTCKTLNVTNNVMPTSKISTATPGDNENACMNKLTPRKQVSTPTPSSWVTDFDDTDLFAVKLPVPSPRLKKVPLNVKPIPNLNLNQSSRPSIEGATDVSIHSAVNSVQMQPVWPSCHVISTIPLTPVKVESQNLKVLQPTQSMGCLETNHILQKSIATDITQPNDAHKRLENKKVDQLDSTKFEPKTLTIIAPSDELVDDTIKAQPVDAAMPTVLSDSQSAHSANTARLQVVGPIADTKATLENDFTTPSDAIQPILGTISTSNKAEPINVSNGNELHQTSTVTEIAPLSTDSSNNIIIDDQAENIKHTTNETSDETSEFEAHLRALDAEVDAIVNSLDSLLINHNQLFNGGGYDISKCQKSDLLTSTDDQEKLPSDFSSIKSSTQSEITLPPLETRNQNDFDGGKSKKKNIDIPIRSECFNQEHMSQSTNPFVTAQKISGLPMKTSKEDEIVDLFDPLLAKPPKQSNDIRRERPKGGLLCRGPLSPPS